MMNVSKIMWVNPATNAAENHPKESTIKNCIVDWNESGEPLMIGESITNIDENGISESWKVIGIDKIRYHNGANLKEYLVENL